MVSNKTLADLYQAATLHQSFVFWRSITIGSNHGNNSILNFNYHEKYK